MKPLLIIGASSLLLLACTQVAVGDRLSEAKSRDGHYISWQEHRIDDIELGNVQLSGSDGLSMADLDQDGFQDFVSVHESDTEYGGDTTGHIRIAFGSADPDQWELITLAEGAEAGAAEDVTIDDLNGDGWPDIVAACELAHLIYFENPGKQLRTGKNWKRNIPAITANRGSWIRVFTADFDQDGQVEVVAANKGDQMADGSQGDDLEKIGLRPVSVFQLMGDPLHDSSWVEHELIRFNVPINSMPIDIDQDGDMDIIGGSRGESRLVLFENISTDSLEFLSHPIHISGSALSADVLAEQQLSHGLISGFNMEFLDLNRDGRLEIILFEDWTELVCLEQPEDWQSPWQLHTIGSNAPDMTVGLCAADINGDGRLDLMTGGYSRGPRDHDGEVDESFLLGRLAWYEHPISPDRPWIRHDISRRKRGMFDKFIAKDMDQDGDIDFVSTRGNSYPYDGVFWLEQVRTEQPQAAFSRARAEDSQEMGLRK